MPQGHECETLLLEHLEWARQTMAAVCRRCRLAEADAEEFMSWATLKLVENDYAVLRQFRGDSSVRTFLSVVIAMLHRDYRAQCWGRFRPSAAARRLGPIAVQLETLVYRDGVSLRQAVAQLLTRGVPGMRERDLLAIFAALPARPPARLDVHADLTAEPVGSSQADDLIADAEATAERNLVETALARAMERLPAYDRQVLRLRYWEGMRVADIARRLGVPQKPLYRRIEQALKALRTALETNGLSRSAALEVLGERAA